MTAALLVLLIGITIGSRQASPRVQLVIAVVLAVLGLIGGGLRYFTSAL